jgi:predicted transcriptional regulator
MRGPISQIAHKPADLNTGERGNRGRIEIIADILHLCTAGSPLKTHLIQRANLSSIMANEYLRDLIARELIEETENSDRSRRAYKIRTEGLRFLYHYAKLKHSLKEKESSNCTIAPTWI